MRIITKGAKLGKCNICGVHGKLTEDHIPPKGATRLNQMQMMRIIDLLSASKTKNSSRLSQNGVKFRTLCADCNNKKLGTNYDPTLVTLSKNVASYLESSLSLPYSSLFSVKQNRLMRCVVGHLLAHGVDEHRLGNVGSDLTDYFLDENLNFPKNIKVYYWIYPYQDQVTVKGAMLSHHYWHSFGFFMLIKFFPIAFMLVVDEPSKWDLPLRRLDNLLTNDIEHEVRVMVNFIDLPAQRWPEAPGDQGMVLYGDNATAAIPYIKK